jgi:hypothetical protein
MAATTSRVWPPLFLTVSWPALGPAQPPIQWVPGTLSRGVKRPEREADHSPPSSAEFVNGGDIPALPHTYLYVNNLTLYVKQKYDVWFCVRKRIWLCCWITMQLIRPRDIFAFYIHLVGHTGWGIGPSQGLYLQRTTKLNSVALVRERTMPAERPLLVGEVSANFRG